MIYRHELSATHPAVAIPLIVVLGLLCYSGIFAAGFKTLDDRAMIINDPVVGDLSRLPDVFTTSYFGDGTYYRPLLKASYMIDRAAFGPAAFYFYATNLLVHLAVAVLVFLLLREFYEDGWVPLAAAVLFVLHPIHWIAVSMLTGRSSSIEGLFFLACVYFFVIFCKGKGRALSYALSLVSFVLALFSRETAVMVPAVLACYLYYFPEPAKRRKSFFALSVFFLVVVLYFLLRQALGVTKLFVPRTPVEIVLEFFTFLRASVTHVRLFVLPYDLHFDRTREVFSHFLDPQLVSAVVFWSALAAALFWAGKKMSSRGRFFLWWALLTLFPVSQIPARILVQPGFITTGEHHLYLPSVGVFALVSSSAAWVYRRDFIARSIFKFMAVGLILCLLSITMGQVKATTDELALHQQALKFEPHNGRLRRSYRAALIGHGRFRELEAEYRRDLMLDADNTASRIGLGKSLIDQGRVREGIAEYEKIADAGAYEALLRENLRLAHQLLKGHHEP